MTLGIFHKQAGLFGSLFWLLEVQNSMASRLSYSTAEKQRGKQSKAEASLWVLFALQQAALGRAKPLETVGLDCE